jgi:4'-phosphopantetheinyl transferase EntD
LIVLDGRVRIATSGMVGSMGDLLPEERVLVADSVASRQVDFATGRLLARRLLRELGLPDRAIVSDADRVPIWPAGIVGSISHTDDACLVAVSDDRSLHGVGVDVEVDAPRSQRFFERITTPAERGRIGPGIDGTRLATRIFSIKEAVYKACYPTTREFWGFRDVEVEFDASSGRFRARVPSSAAGRVEGLLRSRDDRVWTVAHWDERSDADSGAELAWEPGG